MKISDKEISEEFSKGNFSFCYEYFNDDIQWNIVGSKIITTKKDVIAYCNKMTSVMDGSALINTNIISSGSDIAIEGHCNYSDSSKEVCKVSYCDIYHFENEKISVITSYCIDKKTLSSTYI